MRRNVPPRPPSKDLYIGSTHLTVRLGRGEATKAIPVIILTAITARTGIPYGADEIGEFFGSEPEAYMDKPIDPAKLQETVARLLQ